MSDAVNAYKERIKDLEHALRVVKRDLLNGLPRELPIAVIRNVLWASEPESAEKKQEIA